MSILTQKKWPLILLTLVLLGFGGWYYSRWQTQKAAQTTYKEYTVTRGDLAVNILATGVVEPENRLSIKSPVAGRAEKVLINEGDRIKKGQVLAWLSSTERAALLDAATAKGPAERAEWEQMYKPTPILAPIDGMLISRNIESGQTFTVQDAVLVMSDRLTVRAQVDETDIAKIKLKQTAEIILDAYPDSTISARVDQIAFDAKTVNNVTNYIVDVLPIKPPDFIRSGMTANVNFLISSKQNILFLPVEAIKTTEGKSMIVTKLKGSDSKAEPNADGGYSREVQLGISDGKKFEVLSGVDENEVVLVPEFKVQNAKGSGSPFSPMGNSKPKGR